MPPGALRQAVLTLPCAPRTARLFPFRKRATKVAVQQPAASVCSSISSVPFLNLGCAQRVSVRLHDVVKCADAVAVAQQARDAQCVVPPGQ